MLSFSPILQEKQFLRIINHLHHESVLQLSPRNSITFRCMTKSAGQIMSRLKFLHVLMYPEFDMMQRQGLRGSRCRQAVHWRVPQVQPSEYMVISHQGLSTFICLAWGQAWSRQSIARLRTQVSITVAGAPATAGWGSSGWQLIAAVGCISQADP